MLTENRNLPSDLYHGGIVIFPLFPPDIIPWIYLN